MTSNNFFTYRGDDTLGINKLRASAFLTQNKLEKILGQAQEASKIIIGGLH